MELTLKVSSVKDASGNIQLKIPFIETDAGIDASYTTSSIHTIFLTLVPDTQRVKSRVRGIEDELVKAIELIEGAIKEAANEEPKFKMQGSSIELNFVINKSGNISLIVKGGMKSEITNKLKIYFKPRS